MPEKLFIVVATFEYDGTCIETKFLGTCPCSCGAFKLIEDFDYKKYVVEVSQGSFSHEHIVKDIGIDEDTKKMFYSETHYFENGKPEEIDAYQGGTIIFNIFEA